ncbi:MAG: CRTAC1 family protein [Chitinophagaceae bacterium]
MKLFIYAVTTVLILAFASCKTGGNPNQEMASLLASVARKSATPSNFFASEAKLVFYDSILHDLRAYQDAREATFYKGITLLELGQEKKCAEALNALIKNLGPIESSNKDRGLRYLAMAYMRQGERTNCLRNHASQSCLFPVLGNGVHAEQEGSSRAIAIYRELLSRHPDDLESRWLLNIAYMTIGGYPAAVPQDMLIPGLDEFKPTGIKPFSDVAMNMGLNTNNQAGGSIIDDFNNDGLLDVITSSWSLKESMHYARNNGDGTFTDVSDSSGISMFTGGLNIMQTDYNNDGYKDVFVLRGAWLGPYGKQPNSLLRNNGDGTFTDVTIKSGLLSFHPTQTATWNDFNNDGWLDVFIGNESTNITDSNFCELYINNQDGTFTNTIVESNASVLSFVKGVTSGDYNNDGLVDIFLSTLRDRKILLKNEGVKNGVVKFRDVTTEAGLEACNTQTFPTTFMDYDNDGWLDLLVCCYEFRGSLAIYAASEALNLPLHTAAKQFLFRNKHDGTFEDVTDKMGLNKIAFSMGMNIGDIDNDGFLDIYMGTGNPMYQSLVPNKLFHNIGGQSYDDITKEARVGNLQKGHGVSFADLDDDGDQDLYMDMGGAYAGDGYQNALYMNPGQNKNNWITLNLEGVTSNRAAIGAKIRVSFRENGIQRSVYRDVNSGASFGSNPLQQHIGIGTAAVVDQIEIRWPVTGKTQVLTNIRPCQKIRIREGKDSYVKIPQRTIDFASVQSPLISCAPR